jgi:hypothetical protein
MPVVVYFHGCGNGVKLLTIFPLYSLFKALPWNSLYGTRSNNNNHISTNA